MYCCWTFYVALLVVPAFGEDSRPDAKVQVMDT